MELGKDGAIGLGAEEDEAFFEDEEPEEAEPSTTLASSLRALI